MKFLLQCITIFGLILTVTRSAHNVVKDADKESIMNKDDPNEAFDEYKSKYIPQYNEFSPNEKILKKNNFIRNFKIIKKHNNLYAKGETSYKMTINFFTDMNDDEKHRFLGMQNSTIYDYHYNITPNETLDLETRNELKETVNWKDYMTEVKDQGTCGSCFAFAATTLVEFVYTKVTDLKMSFSPQEIVDCLYGTDNKVDKCDKGGDIPQVINYIVNRKHLSSLREYPYTGKSGKCKSDSTPNGMKDIIEVTGVEKINNPKHGENDVMRRIMNYGPVSASFYVEDDFYNFGNEGYYDGCKWEADVSKEPNHAVVITGYHKSYWEIRNSWGKDWGRSGYGYLIRQAGRSNICNILGWNYYVTYKDLGCKGNPEKADKEGEHKFYKDKAGKDCKTKIKPVKDCKCSEYIQQKCEKTCKPYINKDHVTYCSRINYNTVWGPPEKADKEGEDTVCKDTFSNCNIFNLEQCKCSEKLRKGCKKTCKTCDNDFIGKCYRDVVNCETKVDPEDCKCSEFIQQNCNKTCKAYISKDNGKNCNNYKKVWTIPSR